MPPHIASMDSNSLMNPYRNRIAADEMPALRGSPRATDRINGQLSWRRDVVRGGPLPPSEKTCFRRQNLGLRAFSHASCQGVMAPFRSGSRIGWNAGLAAKAGQNHQPSSTPFILLFLLRIISYLSGAICASRRAVHGKSY